MDYKYIEQLLENYWDCTTTVQEEHILRTFFQQAELPAHLERYRSLFAAEEQMAEARLSEDFDERLLARMGEGQAACKARRIGLRERMRPFFHAAGILAVLLTIGLAVERTFEMQEETSEERMANDIDTIAVQAETVPQTQQAAASMPQPDTLSHEIAQ
jgi:hypothetical protein